MLPPKAAPTPVVIIPILLKNKDNSEVLAACQKIKEAVAQDCNVELTIASNTVQATNITSTKSPASRSELKWAREILQTVFAFSPVAV